MKLITSTLRRITGQPMAFHRMGETRFIMETVHSASNVGTCFVIGLSFRTAPVELRERVAMRRAELGCMGCRLKIAAALSEMVLLSTCNRLEIYGVAEQCRVPAGEVLRVIAPPRLDLTPHVYVHQSEAMFRHLFAVTSGLDSMVLGETEITGQVKSAYAAAQNLRLTGRVLNRAFQTALQAAKQIRTYTGIGRGATSVGSVAVELVEKIFEGNLGDKVIMIIGAGKMGEACVRHFAKRGVQSVLVSNRSFTRATELAQAVGGEAIRFDDCLGAMAGVDIVISSTGASQIILHRRDIEAVMQARRRRRLVLVDIAVPRDIDPAVQRLENVYLYDIDDLQEIVRANLSQREQALAQARGLIEQHTAALMNRLGAHPKPPYEQSIHPESRWVFGEFAGHPA